MGKGSGRRPTDEQKFQDNYDAIFWKKDAVVSDNGTKLAWSTFASVGKGQGPSGAVQVFEDNPLYALDEKNATRTI